MSFQNRKTFVHLRNTILDIFDKNLRALWPSIDSNNITTINAQKRSKESVK